MTAQITFLPFVAHADRGQSASSARSVAIVDDEDAVCRAFARLLRAYSYRPQTYRSGPEFLQSLSNSVPACVIVDVHLGDMSGFEVLHRLAGMGMKIPAIVVTARDEPAVQRDFVLSGATVLLIKPVEGTVFLNAIETAMSILDSRDAGG